MEIITTDTPAQAAGEHISKLLKEHDGDTLCLLSGGSALAVVEHITNPNKPECRTVAAQLGELSADASVRQCRTIFMLGDERGSRESEINNFLQLESTYPDSWVTKHCLRTVPEVGESLADFSARITAQLDQTLAELHNPQIIHLMGMGSDGHTAGIFPLDEDQFQSIYELDQSIVPVYLEGLTIDSRASVTPQWILDHVDHVISYAVGESKKMTLESLKNETQAIHERPAELWKLKSGSVVYTDQELS